MSRRLAVALAVSGVVVASLGFTSLGGASVRALSATVIPRAKYALNAGKVGGLKVSRAPQEGLPGRTGLRARPERRAPAGIGAARAIRGRVGLKVFPARLELPGPTAPPAHPARAPCRTCSPRDPTPYLGAMCDGRRPPGSRP